MKALSLYIHIPFCEQKCDYCDFLSFPADEGVKRAYFQALKHELYARSKDFGKDAEDEREIISVYFGGGTPSVVDAEVICDIMNILFTHFTIADDCEISIEVNPGTVDAEKLERYHAAGINRLSIGCQSMHDEELKKLGRIHTKEDIIKTYQAAREVGFTNINIDLMSALPDQSFDDYMDSVAQVVALQPEHISAYALILEEGTPFYDEYSDEVRDEDLDVEMYEETRRYLTTHGYEQYEISNYARTPMPATAPDQESCTPLHDSVRAGMAGQASNRVMCEAHIEMPGESICDGPVTDSKQEACTPLQASVRTGMAGRESNRAMREAHIEMPGESICDVSRRCRHNVVYWKRGEYLGFGLGASSLIGETRFRNTEDIDAYIAADGNTDTMTEDYEVLNYHARMEEFMFLGLRMTEGISVSDFEATFHHPIRRIYAKVIDNLKEDGLLVAEGDTIRLTPLGINVSNYALAQFLFDE